MEQIKRVARAREIQIKTRIIRTQPIVSEIVDSAETKRRPEMVPFGSVIINHVENYFDAGRVEIAHHRFELGDLFAQLPAARIRRVRRKKSDRVVTPVILQAAIDQNLIVDMRVHRQ